MSPPRASRAALLILAALRIAGAGHARAEAPASAEAPPPKLDVRAAGERSTRILPLPLYATTPAEGSTFGVLPVFMRIDGLGRTTSITAPSVSWNKFAGVNGTFRFYSVADETRRWHIILAASTQANRSLRFEYRDVPGHPRRTTFEIQVLARRSLFYRFFGLGPDTNKDDESTYTRELALLSVRGGLNLFPHFNAGVRGGVRWDRPRRGGVSELPQTLDAFPAAPGLDGAALATAELSLRYDTRDEGDYDDGGFASELHLARDFGISRSPSFWRGTWHTRLLWRETSFLTGAARVFWTDELGGRNVPFYYQSALGGDTMFRGFTEDRFIDRAAWQAEVEQRFRLFTTRWFGVVADWRIDPFVAIGQVFPDYRHIVSHVRPVVGVGLRAFVRPNILGRVDVAYASDGLRAYVLLGYPY